MRAHTFADPYSKVVRDDMRLVLKRSRVSEFRMRPDVNRVLVYEIDPRWHTFQGIRFYIHPTHAMVLALLDRGHPVVEAVRTVAFLFSLSLERARDVVECVIRNCASALMPADSERPSAYDPQSFLMSGDSIDVDTYRLQRPIYVIWRVSDDCMRHCVYCNVPRRKTAELRLLPLERIDELAAECQALGVAEIALGGGDPFMRADLVEIIASIVKHGTIPVVTTKSHVSASRAQALADAGLDAIRVSIDSPDPQIADYLAGTPGFFRQIVESIINLRRAGIRVRTNSVITSRNVRRLPRLVELLVELGVESIHLASMKLSMHVGGTEMLLPAFEDCNWLTAQLKRFEGTWDVTAALPVVLPEGESTEDRWRRYFRRRRCTAGTWGLVLHSDGKVTLCDEMPLAEDYIVGDVMRSNLLDVWNSPHILQLRNPPRERFRGTVCCDCEMFDKCHRFGRCFRQALKAYGSLWAPAPFCPRAPMAPRLI